MGLLWFDSDPNRPLAVKIEDAARRYREKFGQPADTCYVNRGVLLGRGGEELASSVLLRVVPSGCIMPHHFLVGREELTVAARA
jgi:hypothetical protein